MLLRMRGLLGAVSQNVTVVAPPLRYAVLGVTSVSDRWEGQGPLAGIITALLTTEESGTVADWNLIYGCDLPFLRESGCHILPSGRSRAVQKSWPQGRRRGWNRFCACWRQQLADKLQNVLMKAYADHPGHEEPGNGSC